MNGTDLLPGRPDTDAVERLLVGSSPLLIELRESVRRLAASPFPVLIGGESGSGKDLVARGLHLAGPRAGAPWLSVNCAAFSPELLAAELFGHARGAYTGAERERAGFFEEAGAGTLFLDEIGELPPALQARFLRVLESGEYYRLGETRPRRARARVVAATHRDLPAAVGRGEFRADLYHRLSVLTLEVPPLRARGDDWRLLLAHFGREFAGLVPAPRFTPEALTVLATHPFPGNVRELRNLYLRLASRHGDGPIDARALSAGLNPLTGTPPPTSLQLRLGDGEFRLDAALEDFERRHVQAALELSAGNLSHTARLLGLNRSTLYSRLGRLGITPLGA